jgi:hypothetical protein
MSTAATFLTNNLISADKLKPNVIYEAMLLRAVPRTFNDGTTRLVLELDNGLAIPLNQTRLHSVIDRGGMNYERWGDLNLLIRYWRGTATFEGREVPAVKMEVIAPDRLVAEKRKAIEEAPVAGEYFNHDRDRDLVPEGVVEDYSPGDTEEFNDND